MGKAASQTKRDAQPADSRGGPQQALEEADLVPQGPGRSVGITEGLPAVLGERRCAISPTWPSVHHEIVLKSKNFLGRPVCALRYTMFHH